MKQSPLFLLFVVGWLLAACAVQSRSSATTSESSGEQQDQSSPTVELLSDLDRLLRLDPFVVQFSQPMDPESAKPPFEFQPAVKGEWSWDNDYRQLTFHPTRGFSIRHRYRVFLNEELTSRAGHRLDQIPSWEFQIRTPPSITGTDLAVRRARTERQPTLQVTFDRPMEQVTVEQALQVTPAFDYRLQWQGSTLKLVAEEKLSPGTRYEILLSKEATDREGLPLARYYRWGYQLANLVEAIEAPVRVDNHSTPLTLSLNYPIQSENLTGTIQIEPAIEGSWQIGEGNRALIFRPAHPLPGDTTYNVQFVAPLRDMDGDELPLPAPLSFKTAPSVTLQHPQIGNEIHPAESVKFQFDRPIDPSSAERAFRIEPATAGHLIWTGESIAVFLPDDGHLQPRTTYTVTIGAEILGMDGEPLLTTPRSWLFRTSELTDLAGFGRGPNAQVIDADGRRAVQFGTYYQFPATLEFELYRLTLDQFLDRYASGFSQAAEGQSHPISTAGTELVHSWTVDFTPDPERAFIGHETLLPEEVEVGLYLLNLKAGSLNDQLILVLTRNVLMVKQAGEQITAWVTAINGSNRPGVEIELYTRSRALAARGRTDENGLLRTSIDEESQPLIVVARDGPDITVSGLSNEWRLGSSPSWGWWQPAPVMQEIAAYIYTDRPIYRPGHTLYFKGILRHEEDANLTLPPPGTPVTARIRDARDNVLQSFDLVTNEFGTVHGEFQLGDGAMLGEYAVEMVVNEERHRQSFKVEDYRKPDYQVTIETDTQRYIQGDTIEIEVNSHYLFGQPVVDAAVTLSFYRIYKGHSWPDKEPVYSWSYLHDVEPIEGRTDANGRFIATLPVNFEPPNLDGWWEPPGRRAIAIEATVEDSSQQQVSQIAMVDMYRTAEQLEIEVGSHVSTPGETITFTANLSTIDGAPVAGHSLEAQLQQAHSSPHFNTITTTSLTTDAAGSATGSLVVEEVGFYRLLVTGEDSQGNLIVRSTWLYIHERDTRSTTQFKEQLQIRADQTHYVPGESAQLIIESRFSGPALLTVERGTVRQERLIELTAPFTRLDWPIRAEDAPNIFVTVHAWQPEERESQSNLYQSLPDSRLHVATTELIVPPLDKKLTITISPDKTTYSPREKSTFTIQVTDQAGNPVAAELSLALVDEAIFALSEELSGSIFDELYAPRKHTVRTYDSMVPARDLCGCGSGGGSGLVEDAALRSDFADTAAWIPAIHTDRNGEARVSFALPDNLTTWRVTVRATTATHTQVGEASVNILTEQPVVVRPLLPRTLTAGDQFSLSAMIFNNSAVERQIALALNVAQPADQPLLVLSTLPTQTIRLEPGERRIVGWSATAHAAGDAVVTIGADGGDRGDAIRLTLPIHPLAVPDITSEIGSVDREFNTLINVPESALDMGHVRVEVSRSIAGSLLPGLEYLTGYPYGCVEQTMSRALPNAVVGRAFHQMGIGNPSMQADLPDLLNSGLQRLYGYQQDDGGWGWWYDDRSHDYQTAWVIFGLVVTAEAGHEVDPGVIKRGATWLQEHLATMDPRTRAYALYSMAIAGYGDQAATRDLIDELDQLDTFSQAALALALHELGNKQQAEELLAYLASRAVIEEGLVYWPAEEHDGAYDSKVMASTTRSTALALSAFARIAPGHELQEGIARWLMAQRKQLGWGTTNETAYTLLALVDHLLATDEEGNNRTGYRIELNDELLASGDLAQQEPIFTLEIPASRLTRGSNWLKIRQEGSGQLYYVVSSHLYLPKRRISAAGGVQIERRYVDPITRKPIRTVKPGQLVQVEVDVRLPEDSAYFIVEDRLPGGLEALNERLNTTSHSTLQFVSQQWDEFGYNQKEVRGDRVSFFITELSQGQHTFTYLARAMHTGRFVALPTEAYAMYDPALWGRSASNLFQIR